jgi:gluconate 5-dehydrogenase
MKCTACGGPLEDGFIPDIGHAQTWVSGWVAGTATTVKGMIERRSGTIINVSSVQSVLARLSIAPYAASKGAITMLTKSMAGEWGQYGIRVNAIAPGYFKTELNSALVADQKFSEWLVGRTPLRRWGEVQELAGAAVFLASQAASFVAGQTLLVDGGITSVL